MEIVGADRREAEHQGIRGARAVGVIGGQGRQLDVAGGRLAKHALGVGAHQVGHRVQAGAHGPQRQRSGAETLRCGGQRLQALEVDRAHAPDVPIEMAAGDEVGEHGLIERRRRSAGGAAGGRHQVRRQDEETQAQGGEERLAEAPHVDDAAVDVEAVQAGDGVGAEAELAVVVVLDHPGARRARPAQQGEAPRQAHRHAERKLVGRRHQGQAGARRGALAGLDVEAVRVDRHADDAGAGAGQRAARHREAGLLHPRLVARVEQQVADQVQPPLGAGDDEHLAGVALGSPRPHLVGDGLAQRPQAGHVPIVEVRPGHRPQAAAGELRPQPEREEIQGGRPDAEGARRTLEAQDDRRQRRQGRAARRQRRMPRLRRGAGGGHLAEIVRQLARHEGAGAALRGQVTLGHQLVDREQGGGAGDAEVQGQRPRRRQPRPRLDGGLQDGPADAGIDLPLQPHAGRGLDGDQEAGGRSFAHRARLGGGLIGRWLSAKDRAYHLVV